MAIVSLLIAIIQMQMGGWIAHCISDKTWYQFARVKIPNLTHISSVLLGELCNLTVLKFFSPIK